MKYLNVILLACLINACNPDIGKENFPIEYVIKNTLEQQNLLHIGIQEGYKQIDSIFFKKWFEGLTVPELENKKLEYSNLRWYFIDQRQIDDKIIFSILSNGEGGALDLYYLTYDTINKKIISINFLVESYGDEGNFQNNIVEWTDKTAFRIISKEINVEDISDSIKIKEIDSFITQYNYSERPFKAKEIYRNSRVDTLKRK